MDRFNIRTLVFLLIILLCSPICHSWGRPAFSTCDDNTTRMSCLKKLIDHEHKSYLEFMLETNTICQQLQSYALENEIERLVNELRRPTQDTEDNLDTLESEFDVLIQNSNMVYESLGSIDIRVQSVAQKTNTIETQLSGLLKKTEEIYQEVTSLSESQSVPREGQEKMRLTLKDGMEMLSDAYTNLEEAIDKLKNETYQMEEEISEIRNSFSQKQQEELFEALLLDY